MISFSSLSKRRGATLAGVFSLALSGVVLLCGAGSAPIENLLPQGAMQGDLNAGGHNLTNAATVYATAVSATNVVVSGSLTAPASFTLPFSQLTSMPTTLSGYGITDAEPASATLTTLAASSPFTPGTNITFSGTWPAITINASGGSLSLGTNFSTLAGISGGVLELTYAPNGPLGLISEGTVITDSAGTQFTVGDETSSGNGLSIVGNGTDTPLYLDDGGAGTALTINSGNIAFNGSSQLWFYSYGAIRGTCQLGLNDPYSSAQLLFGGSYTSDGSALQIDSCNDGSTVFEIGADDSLHFTGSTTNPASGSFTLSSGSSSEIPATMVTANSVIIVSNVGTSGTPGPVSFTLDPGTGFTPAGLTTDNSTYNYVIIN